MGARPPYYITAYGIAVKHGYKGTEEEWLAEVYGGAARAYADAERAEAARIAAEGSAEDSEAWAVGTRSGEDVPETDPAYHNSAAYHAGLAADSAEDASDSAEAAAASEAAAKDYSDHIADPVGGIVTGWLNEHVDPETGYVIDDSLTVEGAAADAAACGKLKSALGDITNEYVNLLDPSDVVDGYINSSGVPETLSGTDWQSTGFIPVENGMTYYFKRRNTSTGVFQKVSMYFLATYTRNAASGFIERVAEANNASIDSSNIKYIRFSFHSTGVDELQVCKIQTQPYFPYGAHYYVNPEKIDGDLARTVDSMATVIKEFPSKNLFDVSKAVDGYINSSGVPEILSETDWKSTDFIPVEYGKKYSASAIYNNNRVRLPYYYFALYNSSKTFLSRVQTGTNNPVEIDNSNAKFIRFSYHSNDFSYVQVEEGTFITSYAEYGGKTGVERSNVFGDELSVWSKKVWVCIGDSLTAINERTTKHYFDYIAEKTGINIINKGVSGSGYYALNDSNQSFYKRASSIDRGADVYTIFGSGNDVATGLPLGDVDDTVADNTLCGYINATIDAIFAREPLANLGIVTPTPWIGQTPDDPTCGMALYSEKLVEICKLRGIPCLDLYHESGLRPNDATFRTLAYSKDDGNGVHPDETGHFLIAPRFQELLIRLLLV